MLYQKCIIEIRYVISKMYNRLIINITCISHKLNNYNIVYNRYQMFNWGDFL